MTSPMQHQASAAAVTTTDAKCTPVTTKPRQINVTAIVTNATRTKRNKVLRIKLFVLVRILFRYLEKVDVVMLDLAKEILKDCERKHNTKDSKYETLAEAIADRLRDAVGEAHWTNAWKIQKQLVADQRRRKVNAALKERNAFKERNNRRLRAFFRELVLYEAKQ
eukprot:CAMPEP_0172314758 /NCGR_PEP_ID=MMETSP1058-20130122/23323_1 /TAXON_ID=83371 /ORGANISM="Detonula confervacea, Strain CCMP 353" /LENGTH=164 /DNA_ID=CAMNT_0013028705 /DNA_START=176 /DNA_END=670 /DNA_ORIENTATION=-